MEYQQAYKIAHEVNEFFNLNFDGRQKAQLSQIILNNINESTQQKHKEWCEVGDGTPCNCGSCNSMLLPNES